MRTAYYKQQNIGASVIGMTYFALVIAGLIFLVGYAVYLSTIKNPPCTRCIDGLAQDVVTNTLTTNVCNTTNVTETANESTILFNFSVSGGCTGPRGDDANITIIVKNNATHTTHTLTTSSVGQSIYNVDITATTTYNTLPGLPGPQGPTSTVPGPQGPIGDQGPQGIPGGLAFRTFRITGPAKQYIPIPVPPGATLLSYTLIGGGGGGGGGCGSRAGGAGGGGGSGFKSQNIFLIDPNAPPSITIRLGMGGAAGTSGVDTACLGCGNTADDGRDGYSTLVYMGGAPFDLAKGGKKGNRCPRPVGQAADGGFGGDGGYGGGGGGTTNTNGHIPCGGISQLVPSQPICGFSYQHGSNNNGGRGDGPNGGLAGIGDINTGRSSGGGGGGGILPGSGGCGATFTSTRTGLDGGGEDACNGLYGGGGGGGPGFNNGQVDGRPGYGGAGYMEYIFF